MGKEEHTVIAHKSVHYLYEKIYLSRILDESMSPDSLSGTLPSLPEEQSITVMRILTENDKESAESD